MASINSSVIVRNAKKEDLGAILAMIQELADFEKMPSGPELTVEDLARDGGFENGGPAVFQSMVLELTEEEQQRQMAKTENNKEKLPSSSSSTAELLTRKLVGYAIFFYSYSTWQGKAFFLEDIYVKPEYRQFGYGRTLFQSLVQHALQNGCSRFDFHVLAWNPAKEFYRRMGAENLTETEEWQFFRLNREKMNQLCQKGSR
ncbi:thialysine N-epsilon-acetyltransferase-like [Uranotaenia lowii]|uniref:thialysine N-epsilon-acetyltransferase-like n=1 Tax=Uranotaenia lowii TaxID=190385 RepID=UPI00247ABFBE|nr:thialysine N-epsilon-acetyltransferase-like [Uranotaenia lowii]